MLDEEIKKEEISDDEEREIYGDPEIVSLNAKVPKFLIATYIILPIWGLVTFYYFWNGSAGWLDRGYWHELQMAANTTFPIENQNSVMNAQVLKDEEKSK